ncbi:MAG: helix-turn-helix domain-containing protein [Planctomycetota bacterium]|nr:helix-turn-helix domain-containing protein [Planctomycetota bacterium]
MHKRFIVTLTDQQRERLAKIVKDFDGAPTNVRRAQVLLKADSGGAQWTDRQIADAYSCTVQTVENIRKRFCLVGLDEVLFKKREHTPRVPKFDGEQEAKVIALRLGPAPEGYSNWTLRLLQNKIVELAIVDSVSPETLRKSLKKMA